jgi:hypothetical protein
MEIIMRTLQAVNGAYGTGKFWIITTAISAGSVIALSHATDGWNEPATAASSLFRVLVLVIAAFGVTVLPFAIWQNVARRRFFAWLEEQSHNLAEGATHPDGYRVTWDTEFVRYRVVFSALLATVSFSSKPYVLHHRHSGVAQASFTLLTLVFGWWYFGPDGVVETLKATVGNIRSSDTFTLRSLSSQQDGSLAHATPK